MCSISKAIGSETSLEADLVSGSVLESDVDLAISDIRRDEAEGRSGQGPWEKCMHACSGQTRGWKLGDTPGLPASSNAVLETRKAVRLGRKTGG